MVMATQYKRFAFLETSDRVNAYDKIFYRQICLQQADETQLKYALVSLMRMLRAHYDKRVILLIDEYDVPLAKSYACGYYGAMMTFLRTFFAEAIKTNPDLHFAAMTGCLRISKESIFTGLNNLNADGISNHRFDEYFGFTDADVRALLQDYGLSAAYSDMRQWYDGYHFGSTDVYCPWDVINHCKRLLEQPDARPEAYWNNSRSNQLVRRFIDKADRSTRQAIEALVAGQAIERPIVENLTYVDIDTKLENLWSVLYLTGYLTQDRTTKAQRAECKRLVIPNLEVRSIFIDQIQSWFADTVQRAGDVLQELYRALATGQAQTVERIISAQLKHTISYFDQKENFYHGFLLGLLAGNQTWDLRSNRETGLGRSDIVLQDDADAFGIVIELKRADNRSDMSSRCDAALAQIQQTRYGDDLLDEVEVVWAYAIAFAQKSCCVKVQQLRANSAPAS